MKIIREHRDELTPGTEQLYGHALLSLSAMVAQQEVLQTTLGKGLGMMFCRIALGDPAKWRTHPRPVTGCTRRTRGAA